VTGLPTWGSGQPGQVGNQAALTVEPVLGSRLVNLILKNQLYAFIKLISFVTYFPFIFSISSTVFALRSALTLATAGRSFMALR
jgi:hypothetical protein